MTVDFPPIGFRRDGTEWDELDWCDYALYGVVIRDSDGKRVDPSILKASDIQTTNP